MTAAMSRLASVGLVTLTVGVSGWAAAAGVASQAASGGCNAVWRVIESPKVPDGELRAVSAASSSDVWAVGESPSEVADDGFPRRTLIEHWDGTSWRVVAGA